MTQPKYPSEQQGGYDPIPTHPEHTTVNPADDWPDDEGGDSSSE